MIARASARARILLALIVTSAGLGVALPDPAPAQERGLEEFAWLAGTWRGAGPDGAVAEIHFLPPEAGVLPSIFRLRRGERVIVLEALSLVKEEDRVIMYVRHFDPALVPLEKERAIELELVERKGADFLFENVHDDENPRRSVLSRTGEGFVSRSELARPDGSTDEIRVEYRRVEPGAER